MNARAEWRRPFSRRTVLTLIWAAAFVILGLVGLRSHSVEPVTVDIPVTTEAQAVASSFEPSASQQVTVPGGDERVAPNIVERSWHLDVVTLCVLTMLVTLVLIALFVRYPWMLLRPNRMSDVPQALPREPARRRPLLLLLSVSRI